MALTFNAINRAASFNPIGAFPLDARSYFESYDAALAAAQIAEEAGSSNVVYYYGQTFVVNEGSKATLYIVQPNNTLKEVGSVPVGDGKSIEVVDGKIKLKGFGAGYWKYNADVEGKYEFVASGFKAGLQPQIVAAASGDGFEIAWFEPNPTTVEGLQSEITALSGSVNALSGKVDSKANSADVYTKDEAESRFMTEEEVDKRVNKVIADAVDNDSIENLTQLVEYIAEHGGEAASMAQSIQTIEGQLNGLEKSSGAVKGYVDAAIGGLNISQYATKGEVGEVVNALSTKADKSSVYTKEEIDNKGFLTEHQDISGKADKTDLEALERVVNGDESTEGTIKNQIKAVKDSIPTTGDINSLIEAKGYATTNDLNDALEGKATEEWVNGKLAGYATNDSVIQALQDNATQTWVNTQLTDYVKIVDLPAPLLQSVSSEFTIDDSKKLSIASVNVNKLVQSEGDELILNGGKA
jgi:hypothetical protein